MEEDQVLLEDYVDEFAPLVKAQLASDNIYYGGTWRHSFSSGWVQQFFDYLDCYRVGCLSFDEAVPWRKVAALAVIGWMRETHPETLCRIRMPQDGEPKDLVNKQMSRGRCNQSATYEGTFLMGERRCVCNEHLGGLVGSAQILALADSNDRCCFLIKDEVEGD